MSDNNGVISSNQHLDEILEPFLSPRWERDARGPTGILSPDVLREDPVLREIVTPHSIDLLVRVFHGNPRSMAETGILVSFFDELRLAALLVLGQMDEDMGLSEKAAQHQRLEPGSSSRPVRDILLDETSTQQQLWDALQAWDDDPEEADMRLFYAETFKSTLLHLIASTMRGAQMPQPPCSEAGRRAILDPRPSDPLPQPRMAKKRPLRLENDDEDASSSENEKGSEPLSSSPGQAVSKVARAAAGGPGGPGGRRPRTRTQ